MPEDIAEGMTDNEALRRILASMQSMEIHLKQEYDSIETTIDIALTTSTTHTVCRAARAVAVATVVANRGANDAYIFEDTKQVAIVKAGESLQLPMTGKGAITARAALSTTTIRVSTYILN